MLEHISGLNDSSLRIRIYGTMMSALDRELRDMTLELLAHSDDRCSVTFSLGAREESLVDAIAESLERDRSDVVRWLLLRGLAETLATCDPATRRAIVDRAASLLGDTCDVVE